MRAASRANTRIGHVQFSGVVALLAWALAGAGCERIGLPGSATPGDRRDHLEKERQRRFLERLVVRACRAEAATSYRVGDTKLRKIEAAAALWDEIAEIEPASQWSCAPAPSEDRSGK